MRKAMSTVASTNVESAYACLIKMALVLNKKAANKAKIEPHCVALSLIMKNAVEQGGCKKSDTSRAHKCKLYDK